MEWSAPSSLPCRPCQPSGHLCKTERILLSGFTDSQPAFCCQSGVLQMAAMSGKVRAPGCGVWNGEIPQGHPRALLVLSGLCLRGKLLFKGVPPAEGCCLASASLGGFPRELYLSSKWDCSLETQVSSANNIH